MRNFSIRKSWIGCLSIPLIFLSAIGFFVQFAESPARAEESPRAAGDWSRFRGPDVAGISGETRVFDEFGGLGLGVTWKTSIGSGYSGIAVSGGKVVTVYADGTSDLAAAFDKESGEVLWTYTIGKMYEGHDGSHDGGIATPLVEGGRVFGLHPWGKLFALDEETGKELWTTHLAEDHQLNKPPYGFGSSPILEDGVLVLELGGEGTAIGGFDPATGKPRWKSGSDTVAYQSAVPMTLGGQRQIVAATDKQLFGLEATTGKIFWQYAHEGSGGRGSQSLVPVPAGEGPVGEGRIFLAHQSDASMMITVRREGDGFKVEKLWEGRAIRNSYNVPVYHDGFVYAYSSRFLTCVDAATGESRWRSRQPGDGFLILVDGRLVIVTKKGSVHVAEATPEGYVEVAGRPVFDDLSWTSPSFAAGSIYARSLGEIARVDLIAGTTAGEIKVAGRGVSESPFGRFLAEVEAAPSGEEGAGGKKAIVDRFLAGQKTFPILEGDTRVHFVYRGAAADVALAGDMFGARQEEPMTRVPGTDFFYLSLDFEADARLNYLFMEDFQEIRDSLNPRQTTTTMVGKDMEISFGRDELLMSWFAMPGWSEPSHLRQAAETSRGRLESHKIESKVITGEIGIEVYLPSGYDADESHRYPVAYLHDGSNAKQRGAIPNSLDNLIGKSVAPVIAVFVNLPAEGPPYAQALVGEVVPFIDQQYRTQASPEGRANIGSTFSAYQALLMTLGLDEHFGKVGVQSLAMFTDMEEAMASALVGEMENPPRIYMDWGKYDMRNPHEAWDMSEVNRKLVKDLSQKGVEVLGGEVHDGSGWSSWRNRTDRLFEALFPLR